MRDYRHNLGPVVNISLYIDVYCDPTFELSQSPMAFQEYLISVKPNITQRRVKIRTPWEKQLTFCKKNSQMFACRGLNPQ